MKIPKTSKSSSNQKTAILLQNRLIIAIVVVLGIIAAVGAQVFENHTLSEKIAHHYPVIFTAGGGKWAGLALVGFGMLIAMLTEMTLHGRWRILAIVPLILVAVCLYPFNQRLSDEDNARISHSRYERCSVKDVTYRDRRGHLQYRFAWVTAGAC